jgi:hypothetical protein
VEADDEAAQRREWDMWGTPGAPPSLDALAFRWQDKWLSPRSFSSCCSASFSPLLGFKP